MEEKYIPWWEILEHIYICASPILIGGGIVIYCLIRKYKLNIFINFAVVILQIIISMIVTLIYIIISLYALNMICIDKYETGAYIVLSLPVILSFCSELTTIPLIYNLIKNFVINISR